MRAKIRRLAASSLRTGDFAGQGVGAATACGAECGGGELAGTGTL